jgi:c-di-GMP-binding flagellar brake protein YcgR
MVKDQGEKMHAAKSKERRKSFRIPLKGGGVVVLHVRTADTRTAGIDDISLSGIAFNSPDLQAPEDNLIKMSILALEEKEGKDLFLSNVTCKISSISATRTDQNRRRYGLQFVNLPQWQQSHLAHFIKAKNRL